MLDIECISYVYKFYRYMSVVQGVNYGYVFINILYLYIMFMVDLMMCIIFIMFYVRC